MWGFRQAEMRAEIRQILTFALLTPGTAAAVAEAGVLVGRWEAGGRPWVLVGVALSQGPGGTGMGQWGSRVLIRGPAGAAVEVQGSQIWWERKVMRAAWQVCVAGGDGLLPSARPHSLPHSPPNT